MRFGSILLLLVSAAALPMRAQTPPPSADAVVLHTELVLPGANARQPAVARDGRVALVVNGDIWIVGPKTDPKPQTRRGLSFSEDVDSRVITFGGASDRDPAWSPDGSYLVFSSDRSGKLDLWRIATNAATTAVPERLTASPFPDAEPAVAEDGRIIFSRGRGAGSQLWVRDADGSERRLTANRATERSPTVSPDGWRLAYVAIDSSGRHLRIRNLRDGSDSVVLSDSRVDRVAWQSPTSLVFTSVRGDSLRSFDVATRAVLAIAGRSEIVSGASRVPGIRTTPEQTFGYNGDPDRLGDRTLVDAFAPFEPDSLMVSSRFTISWRGSGAGTLPTGYGAVAFDQAWHRTAVLYYGTDAGARRAAWEKLATKYRPRAIAAKTTDELKQVIYQMHAERPPYRDPATGKAAVSSAHPVATEAGLHIFRLGGNVVDAAAAVSFALGVVEPDASGIAGYGQMLVYKKGMDRPTLIEFMSRVPEDAGIASAAAPTGRGGGPSTANVPGTVAAMYLAWQKHGSGKVTWPQILAPAIAAARDGFIVSDGLATTFTVERDGFMRSAGSRALFFRDGRALRAGDTLRNPDLAWVLEQIAQKGADGFYKGEVAQKLVDDLRAHGSAIKMSDMARYFAVEREPVSTTYRNYTIYSSAPPVDGGATLSARLNLLEQFKSPKRYFEDAPTTHAMISAWQLVPSTRNRIADPAFWPVNTEPFTSKDTARIRWTCYDPSKALVMANVRVEATGCAPPTATRPPLSVTSAPPECEPHGWDAPNTGPCRAAGTTAYVVGDADGNMVAVTQTLGTWGGSFHVTPGLGFLYNDKLNSYSGGNAVDGYGLRLAYARHGSTLAPTIAFEGTGSKKKPVMAVGAAGNAWITSAVYQTLVGMIDGKLGPQAALEQPRFLPGGGGGRGGAPGVGVTIEGGFSPAVVKQLEAMGYRPSFVSLMGEVRMGYGAAIRVDDGKITAGADPRRSGAAGAIPK